MLNRHGHADKVVEINQAAVAIAREAFGAGAGYVIGDIGPFGGLMEPYGDFTQAQVREAFEEQARALVDAGADAILIETQTSLEELTLGIQAAKQAGAPCIIGSMAYDVTLDGSTFRTMMGIDPERAAKCMQQHGADIVALNCGTGMDMERARQAVLRYKRVTDLPVMAQPNAGQPKLVEMRVIYDETPQQMVRGVVPRLEAGVNILGACCGSSPDHIRAFRGAMDEFLRIGAQHENQAVRSQSGRARETPRAHRRQERRRCPLRGCLYQADESETAGRHSRQMQAARVENRLFGGRQEGRGPVAAVGRRTRPCSHAGCRFTGGGAGRGHRTHGGRRGHFSGAVA